MPKRKQPRERECVAWSVREWGSFASIASALLLVWLNFGPRSKQLPPGGI